jgi:uncharacterized OsmC-like protein
MPTPDIAAALQRVSAVLERRPEAGLHDDAPATARWEGDMRFVAGHPNGRQVSTDMPLEFGGAGDQVTPGWLFRAGLASCAATCIAMTAASEGIVLRVLVVRATSRSDTRGMLGMAGTDGAAVPAAAQDLQLHVRIAADGVPPERLRSLVERSHRQSPVPCVVRTEMPLAVQVEVDADQAGG